jgi:predicted nucleic acid-binding protein
MIVLDASAAVDWLLQTTAGQRIENRIYSRSETLHTPHLLDLEVTQVLRRLNRQGVVSVRRANEAVRDLFEGQKCNRSIRCTVQELGMQHLRCCV